MNHIVCHRFFAGRLVLASVVVTIGVFGNSVPVFGQSADRKQAEQAPDRCAEIRAILDAQAEAWNRGDLDAFMETYWKSPELTFSGGGETTRGWQATLDRYRTRYATRAAMGNLRFDDFELKELGESAALVLGTWHLKNDKGTPHGNFSLVLQKLDGKWVIVHDHSSTAEPKE
jgi:uncharacterized protein (TIGR02246 family)